MYDLRFSFRFYPSHWERKGMPTLSPSIEEQYTDGNHKGQVKIYRDI
jgi:hypothetical protein